MSDTYDIVSDDVDNINDSNEAESVNGEVDRKRKCHSGDVYRYECTEKNRVN